MPFFFVAVLLNEFKKPARALGRVGEFCSARMLLPERPDLLLQCGVMFRVSFGRWIFNLSVDIATAKRY